MDIRDDLQADQAGEMLARHIEWHLKGKPFHIVFEDEIERYWPIKNITDAERETQIRAFAESRGWNAFMHKTDLERTRAIFLPQ
jgi:5S rRNA maturation endonuclease (ribonuclease M5)